MLLRERAQQTKKSFDFEGWWEQVIANSAASMECVNELQCVRRGEGYAVLVNVSVRMNGRGIQTC